VKDCTAARFILCQQLAAMHFNDRLTTPVSPPSKISNSSNRNRKIAITESVDRD
jgi:hypothetical protein